MTYYSDLCYIGLHLFSFSEDHYSIVYLPKRHRCARMVKIEGVLVLLPKNRRINNIFQSFIAPKTKIKLQKTANTGQ
jgi:hypothetical protein